MDSRLDRPLPLSSAGGEARDRRGRVEAIEPPSHPGRAVVSSPFRVRRLDLPRGLD